MRMIDITPTLLNVPATDGTPTDASTGDGCANHIHPSTAANQTADEDKRQGIKPTPSKGSDQATSPQHQPQTVRPFLCKLKVDDLEGLDDDIQAPNSPIPEGRLQYVRTHSGQQCEDSLLQRSARGKRAAAAGTSGSTTGAPTPIAGDVSSIGGDNLNGSQVLDSTYTSLYGSCASSPKQKAVQFSPDSTTHDLGSYRKALASPVRRPSQEETPPPTFSLNQVDDQSA
jgi:hypothetical protein